MNDLISRQAAIDLIDEYMDKCIELHYLPTGEGIKTLIFVLPSAQAEQWIAVSKRLPEDLEEVNVTWVNHDPAPYYNFFKDKPCTATAVHYKEKWYWSSSTCVDLLAEYGRNPNDEIDDGIEIIAWMSLPEPWRGEKDEADT